MKILDATAGFRGIWYQKKHPFVIFMDKRNENITLKKGKNGGRIKINPDIVSEWARAPFPNNHFDMIIFDPPHILREEKLGILTKKYGCLQKSTYKHELENGIKKLFEILKPEGIFIFKWAESDIKIETVLKLFPYKPLFGSQTKSKGYTQTFWILFIKHRLETDITKDYNGATQ